MASSNKKFNKKLALTVAIPAIIMAVIIAVIGVSFAWFSDTAVAQIATINMTVGDVFVMDFVLDKSMQFNQPYHGQTACDSEGRLVTAVHAAEKGYADGSAQYNTYMNDRAYSAPFNLRLDTFGHQVAFSCKITGVDIRNGKNEAITPIILPGNNGTLDNPDDDLEEEDIKLGFTWFIRGADNKLYTPYGTIQDMDAVTDSSTTIPSINIENAALWQVPVLNSGFQAAAGEDGTPNFTFNIVFAPEILYWQQYGSTNFYNQTAVDVYGDSSVDGGFKSAKWNAINKYSSQVYSGSTYTFTVVLTVESVI